VNEAPDQLSAGLNSADHAQPAHIEPRVLVIDADRATLGLLEEWLTAEGCRVVAEHAHIDSQQDGFDLAIVDVPFPRQGGLELLQRVASEYRGTPILALSSAFYASVERTGAVARTLGAAGVLPKPVTREAMIAAVRDLLRMP
jgi:DNA-binding response OmpR family regulator